MSSHHSYRSRAVRAMVILHEEHLRRFVQAWKLAQASSAKLPPSDDPAYASLEDLGKHVLSAARGYLVWICKVLELPDPAVRPAPGVDAMISHADDYLEHVLDRWRDSPLKDIADDQLETPEYQSNWQSRYCIDSMLEHAVMHPIRHTFQLDELMTNR